MWKEEDIFGSILVNLKFTGFLQELSWKNKLKTYFFLFICVLIAVFFTSNFFLKDTVPVANITNGVVSFIQISVKAATLIAFREDFIDINVKRKQLWPLESMGKKLEMRLKYFRRCLCNGFKAYMFINCFIYFTIFIKAIFFQEMPLPCWSPKGKYWKIGIIVYQLVFIPYPILIIQFYDYLLSASYLEAYFQFRLINCGFLNMKTMEDIEKCHIHQHFLFGYVKKLNKVFSIFLMVQYFLTISVGCTSIYVATNQNENFGSKIFSIAYLTSAMVQMSFLCIGPTLVADESDALLMAVWNCQWYEKNLKFKKYVLFVMTFCKSKLSVQAGGLIEMNRDAFINVFKSIFSVYTLIKASNDLDRK